MTGQSLFWVFTQGTWKQQLKKTRVSMSMQRYRQQPGREAAHVPSMGVGKAAGGWPGRGSWLERRPDTAMLGSIPGQGT